MSSFFQNHFNIENIRRYFFTKHHRFTQQSHFKKLTQQQPPWSSPPHHKNTRSNTLHNNDNEDVFSFPNKPKSSVYKNQQENQHIPIEIPVVEKVYYLKVNFAESMYRVVIHDNGLEYMYTPERYITLAIPSIKRPFAKQVIKNIMLYKNAIVITAPLNDAIFYMKKLQRYSFTVTLEEA
jgi:hypothetical protein